VNLKLSEKSISYKDAAPSPMLAQYKQIKEAHPGCLLFFRLGDFYELFYEDAVTAAQALDITLTQRGGTKGEGVPMCGVPFHAYEAYLARLIKQGFRVAICEQMESPEVAKKRKGKTLVKRDVVRIVTPGTLTEDTLLDARAHNFLLSISPLFPKSSTLGLAWLDMSTGDFFLERGNLNALSSVLARFNPNEIIIPDSLYGHPELQECIRAYRKALVPTPDSRFDPKNGHDRLMEAFNVKTLEGFGNFQQDEISAGGALLDYVMLTQKGKAPRLAHPKKINAQKTLQIDASTRNSLEVNRTLSGESQGSLLHTIDKTVTSAGARLFAARLNTPLTDPSAINSRLEMVSTFVSQDQLLQSVREALKRSPDIERVLSRLTLGRGGPRDLAAIRDGLKVGKVLLQMLGQPQQKPFPAGINKISKNLGNHEELIQELESALAETLPLLSRDGGFIAQGYRSQLDEFIELRDQGRKLVADLQGKYKEQTGVQSLKIKHNNVLGYFVDVTPMHREKLQDQFIHRQTLANSVRFTTVELSELEENINSSSEKSLLLEMDLFEELVQQILSQGDTIGKVASGIAGLDVCTALAELASQNNYCHPQVDDSIAFTIKGGRHPVVEKVLQESESDPFVVNDCILQESESIWLLTGPNMAGKSTFLRQNALMVILAQMGSFIPAESAHIGCVDKLFSRVGASDDLARGQSTFMVEMVETAAILNQATEHSLVILDEIGRGTATYDGLSLAWASLEHLHEKNKCRTLFATHYHEMTELETKLSRLSCHTMRIREWENSIIFLHEVIKGVADRSYGIHVAQLAGLPNDVIKRASKILERLESQDKGSTRKQVSEELPLFSPFVHQDLQEENVSPIVREVEELDPNSMTPKEALDTLFRLKELLES